MVHIVDMFMSWHARDNSVRPWSWLRLISSSLHCIHYTKSSQSTDSIRACSSEIRLSKTDPIVIEIPSPTPAPTSSNFGCTLISYYFGGQAYGNIRRLRRFQLEYQLSQVQQRKLGHTCHRLLWRPSDLWEMSFSLI